MQDKELIEQLIKFVEGMVDFDTFWDEYLNNLKYKKLFEVKLGDRYRCFGKGTVNEHLMIYAPDTAMGKAVIHSDICRYLEYYGYTFNKNTKYHDELQFRVDIQPSYVNIEDEKFLNEIISQVPIKLTKTNKKKWLKNKIKDIFKYDNKPPRWIQNPEWPIVNGKALVFKSQTKEQKNDERVYYTFYNPDTYEETTIIQFY